MFEEENKFDWSGKMIYFLLYFSLFLLETMSKYVEYDLSND